IPATSKLEREGCETSNSSRNESSIKEIFSSNSEISPSPPNGSHHCRIFFISLHTYNLNPELKSLIAKLMSCRVNAITFLGLHSDNFSLVSFHTLNTILKTRNHALLLESEIKRAPNTFAK